MKIEQLHSNLNINFEMKDFWDKKKQKFYLLVIWSLLEDFQEFTNGTLKTSFQMMDSES